MSIKGSIKTKIYAILGLILAVFAVSAVIILYSINHANKDADIVNALGKQRMLSQAISKSALGYYADKERFKAIRNQAITVDLYIAQMRAEYANSVIRAAKKSSLVISMNPEKEAHPAVPFPATFSRLVNDRFAKQKNKLGVELYVDILAKFPINPAKGLKTDSDKRADAYLSEHPEEVYFEPLEEDGKLYLLFYSADIASVKSCASCHNALTDQSSFKVGDILGIRKHKALFNEDAAAGLEELNPSLDDYQAAKTIFAKTLSAVKSGGEYYIDLKMENTSTVDKVDNERIQEKIIQIQNMFQELVKAGDELVTLNMEKNAGQLRRVVIDSSNTLRELSNDLVIMYTELANKNQQSISMAVQLSGIAILMIIITAVILFNRGVIAPISAMTETIHAIEQKSDLSRRIVVKGNSEVSQAARAFNKMLDKFQSIVSDVAGSAEHLATATTELSATTDQNTSQAKTQQSKVSDVTLAVEQISDAISGIAKNALDVAKTAEETRRQAKDGGEIIDRSGDAIMKLSESSNKIGGILASIQDIAKKTDLLAINAAIEAANAGDQGKGFAVVADEVRKLAERTSRATTEINRMIEDIQSFTAEAVELMNNSSNAMDKIIVETTRVNQMVDQIAVGTEKQSSSVGAAVENVRMIKELSEGFVSAASQTQSVAENINDQSNALQQVVDQFLIGQEPKENTLDKEDFV